MNETFRTTQVNNSNTTNEAMENNSSNIIDNTFQKMFYNYTVPPQMLLSFFVMFANLTILCCIHWIQRPLSSILVLSLSLAMADVCTTLGYTLSLFINSFLRVVYEVEYPILGQIVDSLRQSGAIMTVLHLLTLSLYHYLGILKPLQYHSARATKKIILVITVLWIGPLILVCVIFEHVLDLEWLENRITFASLFFVPLLFMCFFYARILCILQRQQKIWAQLSRNGSSRWKPLKSKTSGEKNQHQRHVEGNIRAVKTTLYILGSCVIGWTPAALIMVFKDYVSKTDNEVFFPIFFVKNILLILKSLANPIIYTIRMTEIQDGMRRLQHAVVNKIFCNCSGSKIISTPVPNLQWSQSSQSSKVASLHSFRTKESTANLTGIRNDLLVTNV